MKTKTTTAKTNAATAAQTIESVPVPPAPITSTHFLLRRGMLELVSERRHLDRDLAAFGGLRPTDTLIYGVLSGGDFVQRGERVGAEADLAHNKLRRGASGKMALVDEMILSGQHTALAVAEAVVAKFGGDLQKTLVVVRSRPWHLRKSGKLAAGTTPFLPAARTRATSGASPIIRSMLLEQSHTVDAIVAAVTKATGINDPKRLKALVRSMPWHLRKQGLTCGYVKVKGVKPAAKPTKAAAKAAPKAAKAKAKPAAKQPAKRSKPAKTMLAAA